MNKTVLQGKSKRALLGGKRNTERASRGRETSRSPGHRVWRKSRGGSCWGWERGKVCRSNHNPKQQGQSKLGVKTTPWIGKLHVSKTNYHIEAKGLKRAGDEEMGRAPVGFLPRNYWWLKVARRKNRTNKRRLILFLLAFLWKIRPSFVCRVKGQH